MRVHRVAPGEYRLEMPSGRVWTVSRLNYGRGPEWTAAVEGQDIALDPLPTLRRAKRAAELAEAALVREEAGPLERGALVRVADYAPPRYSLTSSAPGELIEVAGETGEVACTTRSGRSAIVRFEDGVQVWLPTSALSTQEGGGG